MLLKVKVTPNAKRNKIIGWIEDTLKIKIAAPPQKGKANKELIKFLSEEFKILKSEVEIKRGFKDRTKLIEINSSKRINLPPKQKRLI